jgi:hypothetical protein
MTMAKTEGHVQPREQSHCSAYELVATRYDRLAETYPIYAGMWRARARILRKEHEQLHAAAPAKGGAT